MIENDSAVAFEEHRPFLTKLACKITGNWSDAEDLVHQAYLRWQKVDVRTVRNARALLATIVGRLALNHRASAKVRHEVIVEPNGINRLKEAASEDISSFTDALTNAIEIVLSRLSPPERAVFLLHEVFQFEYAELSELLGESEANCRQRLKRARDRISLRESRFKIRRDVCELAIERFLKASRDGNIDELIEAVAPEVVLARDPEDVGFPKPALGLGKDTLFDHVGGYLRRRQNVTWSCCQIGEYQIAILVDSIEKPLCAVICKVEDAIIKQVDHITCPTRFGMLLNLIGSPG